MPELRIAADSHIPIPDWMVPEGGIIHRFDSSNGFPGWVPDMDALLIRTVCPVTSETLPDTGQLQFVGSATAGFDHVDASWLERNGVRFACSRGCNARSVAEYVAIALLLRSDESGWAFTEQTIGIVGAGFAGRETGRLLEQLGAAVLYHDPLREAEDPNFQGVSREKILSSSILSFHTSYHREPPYPSHHWLDETSIRSLNAHTVVNASRGGVVQESALAHGLDIGTPSCAILDVWEEEPDPDPSQVARCWLGTPHIAGYSVEAKEKATRMVMDLLCEQFQRPSPTPIDPLPPHLVGFRDERTLPPPGSTRELVQAIHPILTFDERLRDITKLAPSERGRAFLRLRAETPLRREFGSLRVPESWTREWSVLKTLGIESE